MKKTFAVGVAIFAFLLTSSAHANERCFTRVVDTLSEKLVIASGPSHWRICLIYSPSDGDHGGEITMTVRSRTQASNSDHLEELKLQGNTGNAVNGRSTENCAVVGLQSGETLAAIHTAGEPTRRLINVCLMPAN